MVQLHPASVHFPIAFIALTGFLDVIYAAAAFPYTKPLVTAACSFLGIELTIITLLPIASYYTTILALLTTIPAVITGGQDLLPLLKRDGLNTPKARTALTHAALNDLATLSLVYNWWVRRQNKGFAPTSVTTGLSGLLAVPVMFYAASLGGKLVYEFGMGVGKLKGSQKKVQ